MFSKCNYTIEYRKIKHHGNADDHFDMEEMDKKLLKEATESQTVEYKVHPFYKGLNPLLCLKLGTQSTQRTPLGTCCYR